MSFVIPLEENGAFCCLNCHSCAQLTSVQGEVCCQECGFCYMDNISSEYRPSCNGADGDQHQTYYGDGSDRGCIGERQFRKIYYETSTYARRILLCVQGREQPSREKMKIIDELLRHQELPWDQLRGEDDLRRLLKLCQLPHLYVDSQLILKRLISLYRPDLQGRIWTNPDFPPELERDLQILFKRCVELYWRHGLYTNKKKFLPIQFVFRRLIELLMDYCWLEDYTIKPAYLDAFRELRSTRCHENERQWLVLKGLLLDGGYMSDLRHPFYISKISKS